MSEIASCSNLCHDVLPNDDDDVRHHFRSMELALGNILVPGSIQVLELGSILELELELDSKQVLALGSILALELELDSILAPVRSSRCHDDDGDQLLQLVQKTLLPPTQPRLE